MLFQKQSMHTTASYLACVFTRGDIPPRATWFWSARLLDYVLECLAQVRGGNARKLLDSMIKGSGGSFKYLKYWISRVGVALNFNPPDGIENAWIGLFPFGSLIFYLRGVQKKWQGEGHRNLVALWIPHNIVDLSIKYQFQCQYQ